MSKKLREMRYRKLTVSDLDSFVSFRDWCYKNIESFKRRNLKEGREKISIDEAKKILKFIEDSLIGEKGKEYKEKVKKLKERLDLYEKEDEKKFIP